MELEPSEEQLLVQRTARDFAERVLVPKAAERDQNGEFPEQEMKELGKLGLLAIAVPEELGGAGMGPVAYSLALQEIARGDASVAVAMSVTNMVGELIANNGTQAQREQWNPKIASGELISGSFALRSSSGLAYTGSMSSRSLERRAVSSAPCAVVPVSGTYIFGSSGRRCETWTPSGPSQNLPPATGGVCSVFAIGSTSNVSASSPVDGSVIVAASCAVA